MSTLTDPENAAHDRTINDDIDAIVASESGYPYDKDGRTADEVQRHKESYPWLYNEAGEYDPSFQNRPELDHGHSSPANPVIEADNRRIDAPADVTNVHMTQEQALAHQEQMFYDALIIMKKKRFDYSGTIDPFKNLRDASFVGVNPLQGVMVRIMDKFARIRSFIEEGTLKVNDESTRDTLVDVLNYTCILAAMIEEEK